MPNLQDKKLLDDKDYLLQRIEDIGTDKALAEYIKQHPKKALSGASALVRNIRAAQQVVRNSQDPVLETPFDIQNFNLTGLLKEWTEDFELHHQKAFILVGISWKELERVASARLSLLRFFVSNINSRLWLLTTVKTFKESTILTRPLLSMTLILMISPALKKLP